LPYSSYPSDGDESTDWRSLDATADEVDRRFSQYQGKLDDLDALI
jgi:hypothetical protein